MNRVRIQQLLVVGLLLIWPFLMMKPKPPSLPVSSVTAAPATAPPTAVSATEMPPPGEAPLDVASIKDPFLLPDSLKESMRRKEEQARQAERLKAEAWQRELDQQRQGIPAPEAIKIQPPPLELQGILLGGPRPQVIINRKILSVGDTIDGATVARIRKDEVTISFQGSEFPLELPSGQKDRSGRPKREGPTGWSAER